MASRGGAARAPLLRCQSRTIVKGDARCLSIAAASIIAKVSRDRLMIALQCLHGMLASEATGSGMLPSRALFPTDAAWKQAGVREALQWADALIDEASR